MSIKSDDSLLVEVIESHEDRVRVVALFEADQQHCHCDADIIRNRDAEIERLRAALADVVGYGTILPDELYSRILRLLGSDKN